jgi:hypothetical protein
MLVCVSVRVRINIRVYISVSNFGRGLRAFSQSKVYIQSQNLAMGSAPSVSQSVFSVSTFGRGLRAFSQSKVYIQSQRVRYMYITVLILFVVVVLMTYLFEFAGVCVADRRVNRKHC